MSERYAITGACVLLSTVAAWSSAVAQQANPLAPVVRENSVTADVAEAYDSNVAEASEQVAAERHLKLSDLIFSPEISATGFLPIGRESLFIAATGRYDFYSRNHILDRQGVDAAAGANLQLSSCKGTLTGGYGAHQTELEDITGPTQTTSVVRSTTDQELVQLSASCGRPIGLRPSFSVSQSYLTYSDQTLAPLNNHVFAANGGLAYVQPAFGSLQVYGSYSEIAYDHPFAFEVLNPNPPPPTDLITIKNGSDVYGAGLRYDRTVGSRLEGTVSAGYLSVQPFAAINPSFSGATYNADLTYNLSSRATLHAQAGRLTQPSAQLGASYYIQNTYESDAAYTLTSRWKVKVGYSHETRDYSIPQKSAETAQLIQNEAIDTVTAGTRYDLSAHFYVALDYQWRNRDSNLEEYNFNNHHVTLKLASVF